MLCLSASLALLTTAAALQDCGHCAGRWHDEASDDWMHVTEDSCMLTSKYGAVQMVGVQVTPASGILKTLGITGEFNEATMSIRWSNGVAWHMLPASGMSGGGGSSSGSGVDSRVVQLEMLVEKLFGETQALREAVASLSTCSGCPLANGTASPGETSVPDTNSPPGMTRAPPTKAPLTPAPPTAAPPTMAPPTPAPLTPAPPTAAPPTMAPPTPAPLTPAPPTDVPGVSPTTDELQQLAARVDILEQSPGKAGRDGYCAVEPNMTWTYVPVARYPRTVSGRECVTGAISPRGPPGSAGKPTMMTTPFMTEAKCKWGSAIHADAIYAYTGDEMVFWRAGDSKYNIYQLKDKPSWDNCNFEDATLLAGQRDLEAKEAAGNNFTIVLDKPGAYYFASDKAGKVGDERKENCWHYRSDGTYPGQKSKWGRGVKMAVIVLEPSKEVLAECPLYDASKFGVSGGQAADSESVERLKGAVGAISRQLIQYEVRLQERVRAQGNSGLTVTRAKGQGSDAYFQESFVGSSGPANAHNHANFKYTIGMGEFGAVLNGVQFTTRHNDYSLVQPDDTKTEEEYMSTWPTKSRSIDLPGVPQSVLDKISVEDQIVEMREYFRAFHEQDSSIRADYDKYFKANLCYLEGTWTEAQKNVAEPFASDRHHIDADTWEDLHAKTNYLFNNGQKSSQENLPFLPTAFRAMRESTTGDTFEPRTAQWFYRINCQPIEEKVSTRRFRAANALHLQFSRTTPKTKKSMASMSRGMFELNPTLRHKYNDEKAWPRGGTRLEFLDQLMQQIPGFNGPKAFLDDKSFGPTCTNYNGSGLLNSAHYSRYYAIAGKDAMGDSQKKRSYNDLLFAAQTTHKRVSPQEACQDYAENDFATSDDKARVKECAAIKDKFDCFGHAKWEGDPDTGSSGAKCVWTGKCVYKKCWTQRWSYAIPLEIIYTTPLSEWNPYNIDYFERGTDGYDNVASNGKKGTESAPYEGSRRNVFFRTPADFFSKDLADPDAADTSGGETYVRDKSGTKRKVCNMRCDQHSYTNMSNTPPHTTTGTRIGALADVPRDCRRWAREAALPYHANPRVRFLDVEGGKGCAGACDGEGKQPSDQRHYCRVPCRVVWGRADPDVWGGTRAQGMGLVYCICHILTLLYWIYMSSY